jgi:hypothetical protein
VGLDRWLEDAIEPLEARAAEIGWSRMVERDFQKAMELVRPATSRTVLLEHWPSVGAIDLLDVHGRAVELK